MKKSTSYRDSVEHIKKMLACLSRYIEINNSQGTNDINVACENLVLMLMNSVYGYKLENFNGKRHMSNAAGIDLIDLTNKVCVQVTSKQTKKKLDDTLKLCKENSKLKHYKLKFFIISNKAKKTVRSYKDEEFKFDGATDAVDFRSLCADLKSLNHEWVIELDMRIQSWLGENYYGVDEFCDAIEKSKDTLFFKDGEQYYPRRISAYSNKDDSYLVERFINPDKYKEYTLEEYVMGKAKGFESKQWLLIAAGQAGKTYEARKLYSLLKENESNVFPLFFETKMFNHNQELSIPHFWQSNHIVYIIDGYDEISSEERREKFLIEITTLQRKYPELRVVITCRRNFIANDKVLTDFQRLYLKDLCFDDVKSIIKQSGIDHQEDFLRQIEENNLYSLVYVPFYLNGLLDCYRTHTKIPNDRLHIYEFLIDRSFTADNERKLGSVIDVRLRGTKLLQRIALVMQFTEKKELSIEDIADMDISEDDMRCCLGYTLFHRNDRGYYRFEKNAFQLYYVAKYLSMLNEDAILDLISYRNNGINRIKPEWLDAFELLLSVLSNGSKKDYLLDWTYNNHAEALLNIDTNCLDSYFFHKVFKKVLLEYKNKRISSSPDCGWSFDRKLAAFCLNRNSLDFFLQEYDNEAELGAYLYLLSFIFWFISPDIINRNGLKATFKTSAYKRLEEFGDNDGRWYEAPYIPFSNEIFANTDDIKRLIELTSSIKHVLLKKSIYKLIVASSSYDEFVDFSIKNDSEIHDFARKSDSAIVSVNRDNVVTALGNVSQYDSLIKLWQYYPTIADKTHYNYHDEEAIKVLSQLIVNTEKLIIEHSNLKDFVDNAWLKVYDNRHSFFYGQDGKKIFSAFRGFMSTHCDIDEIRTIFEELRMIHKTSGSYSDYVQLQAKLFIRLTPSDITSIAEEWGDDEYFRTTIFYLRNAPSKELCDEIETFIKTKYAHYLATIPKPQDYESIHRHDKEIAFDRKRFNQYISSILDKNAVKTKKELKLQLKDDEEEQINEYLWQYLSHYYLNNSDEYDKKAILDSLESKCHFALFIINTFHNDDTLSEEQIKVLKESVCNLLSSKRFRLDNAGCRICSKIIVKYRFDMPEEFILRLIPYAELDYGLSTDKEHSDYITYAVQKCGFELVKNEIVNLLKQNTENINYDTLILLVRSAAYYSVKESYKDVLRHIMNVKYPINLADFFYRSNESEGLSFLMNNYDSLPADVQLYIISKVIKDDRNKEWAIEAIKRNDSAYDDGQKAEAIKYLVRLGDGQALKECVTATRNDYKALWEPCDVPSFMYTDTKYLEDILELLRLTWNLPDSFNTWCSRLQNTLLNMASQSIDQFNQVLSALEKLVKSDAKYSSLNYFIGELRCTYEPQVVGAKPLTVKEAMRFIREHDV